MKQFLLASWLCLGLSYSSYALSSSIKKVNIHQALASFTVISQQWEGKGSITGSIQDSETNKGIAGASLILQKLDNPSVRQVAVSDVDGAFQLDNLADGSYSLTIGHLGYKKHSITHIVINTDKRKLRLPIIKLTAGQNQLAEVVVRAPEPVYLSQQLDRMVVNVGTLISNTGASAVDVLNGSPGVVVNDDGGISLRGKEGVLVLVDDKPTYVTGKDLINYLRSLPSGMLDKIEIMPNPPAKYNAEGGAGIINIKTKKIRNNGLNGNLSLSYARSKYGKTTNNLNLNYKVNKVNIFGALGYSSINTFFISNRQTSYPLITENTLLQNRTETSNTKGFNYKLGIDYELGKRTSMGILLNGSANPYKENGDYLNHFVAPNGAPDSLACVGSEFTKHPNRNIVSFSLRHQFDSPDREINISIDHLRYNERAEQTSESDTYLPDQTLKNRYTLVTNSPFNARIYSARVDYSDKLIGGVKLETGAQTTYSTRANRGDYYNKVNDAPALSLNRELSNTSAYQEYISALYFSALRDFRRLSIKAGLRLENTYANAQYAQLSSNQNSTLKLNYTNLFPTAYLSYKLDTGGLNMLILSLGRRISRPSYGDLNPSVFFFDKNTSNTGNPLLLPEYTNNAELTYSYSGKISVGFLYNQTKGTIIEAYQQKDNAFTFTKMNLDRVLSWGLNVNGSVPLTKWWSVNLYSELTRTHFRGLLFSDEYIDRTNTAFRLSGNSRFVINKSLSAEISGLYRTSIQYTQTRIGSAWQLHASVLKKLNDRAAIVLTARNIFNSWALNRFIDTRYAQVTSFSRLDMQVVNLTFTYRFGSSGNNKERKSGIQNESGRL